MDNLQLNQFFEYLNLKKLQEENKAVNLYVPISFDKNGISAANAATVIVENATNKTYINIYNNLQLFMQKFFEVNTVWAPRVNIQSWFEIKKSAAIGIPAGPSIFLKPKTNGCSIAVKLSSKAAGIINQKDFSEFINRVDITGNKIYNIGDGDLSNFFKVPSIEFYCNNYTKSRSSIDFTDFKLKFESPEYSNLIHTAFQESQSGITTAVINFLVEKFKGSQSSSIQTAPDKSNYNTFTVMQINAAQRAVEKASLNRSVIKNLNNILKENFLSEDYLYKKNEWNKNEPAAGDVEIIKSIQSVQNPFTIQTKCIQHNIVKENLSKKKELSLKEAERMGTIVSRSIDGDKMTNLTETHMILAFNVTPNKSFINSLQNILKQAYENNAPKIADKTEAAINKTEDTLKKATSTLGDNLSKSTIVENQNTLENFKYEDFFKYMESSLGTNIINSIKNTKNKVNKAKGKIKNTEEKYKNDFNEKMKEIADAIDFSSKIVKVPEILNEFRENFIGDLNKSNKFNKITYGEEVFHLQFEASDANIPEEQLKVINKNTFSFGLTITKTGSRNSITNMALKTIVSL